MAAGPDIAALVEAWAPQIAKAFLEAIALIRDRAQVGQIATMLERGDINGALSAVGLDPAAFRSLDTALAQAFEAGGNATTTKIPASRTAVGHRLDILFNARNPEAEDWLRSHSASLVTEIVEDQRTMLRAALTAGMEKGRNPRDVALDIVGRINRTTRRREGGAIGLTTSQEEWVRNYEAELAAGDPKALTRTLRDKRFDRTVARAIREGQQIPAEVLAKMVAAYRNRALRYRGEAIGRTEAMAALHKAQDESFRQAIAAGQVDARDVRKVWRSAGDGRVRDTHRMLNGETVGFTQSFASPSGARLRYPGDARAPAAEIIQCRCWCEYRIDFLANVD